MNYWVMHIIKGQIYAIGPYKSEKAAENRMEKMQGGEAYLFKTYQGEVEKAIDEYKVELIGGGK